MAIGTALAIGLIAGGAAGGAFAAKKVADKKNKALEAALAQQGSGGGGGPDPASVPKLDIGALGSSAQQAAIRRKKIAQSGSFFTPSQRLAVLPESLKRGRAALEAAGRGTVDQTAQSKAAAPLTSQAPPAQPVPELRAPRGVSGLVAARVPDYLRGRIRTLGKTS